MKDTGHYHNDNLFLNVDGIVYRVEVDAEGDSCYTEGSMSRNYIEPPDDDFHAYDIEQKWFTPDGIEIMPTMEMQERLKRYLENETDFEEDWGL